MTTADMKRSDSLWWLVVSPAIWVFHLLGTYVTVAVFCSKAAAPNASLGSVRAPLSIYAALALIGIGGVLVRGSRRYIKTIGSDPQASDSVIGRHRFLAFATILLSALSAIAVVYVSLPLLFIGTCR